MKTRKLIESLQLSILIALCIIRTCSSIDNGQQQRGSGEIDGNFLIVDHLSDNERETRIKWRDLMGKETTLDLDGDERYANRWDEKRLMILKKSQQIECVCLLENTFNHLGDVCVMCVTWPSTRLDCAVCAGEDLRDNRKSFGHFSLLAHAAGQHRNAIKISNPEEWKIYHFLKFSV